MESPEFCTQMLTFEICRYVVQDSIYTSDGWNIRTMREYMNATHIEMVSVDDREWSVVRDVDGKLWRVNFTGILGKKVLDMGLSERILS